MVVIKYICNFFRLLTLFIIEIIGVLLLLLLLCLFMMMMMKKETSSNILLLYFLYIVVIDVTFVCTRACVGAWHDISTRDVQSIAQDATNLRLGAAKIMQFEEGFVSLSLYKYSRLGNTTRKSNNIPRTNNSAVRNNRQPSPFGASY